MKMLARSPEKLTPQEILEIGKGKSLIEKAYMERLLLIDRFGGRPSIDYQFQAMDDFLQLFSRTLSKHMVATVLPAFPKSDSPEVNAARARFIKSWETVNEIRASKYSNSNEDLIEVAEPIEYENFEEVYERASEEMQKVISRPYWFETTKNTLDDKEPGGRE